MERLIKFIFLVVLCKVNRKTKKQRHEKDFDPFFTTKPKGIGLGLSIAYQIINKHGGSISVESRWEKGTSFVIHLPESAENP